ncbi:MAG: Mrp/NBP35 family ATP-binding protein [Dorea sp.]|uniref:Mrp/NBP35 family ATP-binding protein n=1 Tax=Sporofaciens musculi TaxID=2681861 RepID=UPI0021732F55|nr:Mrp/NBP35 family ATP-binding protein [Sporofaciens musculi]MCI9422566.1 Mrp/NBP35 family ATP-binding protein [Dorea sp.]
MAEEQQNGCTSSDCAGCAHVGSCSSKPQDLREPANPFSKIKKVIAVVSGKGGVGKSLVTASLARMMREQGFQVGILDADVTGPSIPKMYGIHEKAKGDEAGIFPCEAKDGTRIMSVNLLLENESDPVIWRGPVIAGVVTQFWTDVMWGELDYLFVDMPPGTGDVPLTVFQSLPVDGVVIVTSPQDLVQMIVKKAFNMAKAMNIPVLGIVENYSYLVCPDCGKQISVFGVSHVDQAAEELGIPVLGKMPIDARLAEAVENEKFHEISNEYLKAAVNQI